MIKKEPSTFVSVNIDTTERLSEVIIVLSDVFHFGRGIAYKSKRWQYYFDKLFLCIFFACCMARLDDYKTKRALAQGVV